MADVFSIHEAMGSVFSSTTGWVVGGDSRSQHLRLQTSQFFLSLEGNMDRTDRATDVNERFQVQYFLEAKEVQSVAVDNDVLALSLCVSVSLPLLLSPLLSLEIKVTIG